jgi:hypothetical protein
MGRRRGDSLANIKAFFHKNYEAVDESDGDKLKNEFVVMGASTKKTLTLQFTLESIRVFVHDEDGLSWIETVPFTHIKSIAASKNVVAVDWHHGPYKTQDVSRFHTSEGEAKMIRDKFYLLVAPPK